MKKKHEEELEPAATTEAVPDELAPVNEIDTRPAANARLIDALLHARRGGVLNLADIDALLEQLGHK